MSLIIEIHCKNGQLIRRGKVNRSTAAVAFRPADLAATLDSRVMTEGLQLAPLTLSRGPGAPLLDLLALVQSLASLTWHPITGLGPGRLELEPQP